jgi:hypothetical protein
MYMKAWFVMLCEELWWPGGRAFRDPPPGPKAGNGATLNNTTSAAAATMLIQADFLMAAITSPLLAPDPSSTIFIVSFVP